MIWVNNHTMHRRADFFPCPDEFIPERFLSGKDMWEGQGEIKNGTWRPFEKGPRGCIGQELAMLEMKIILVMSVGGFDVKAEYEKWEVKIGRENPGSEINGQRMMFGMFIPLLTLFCFLRVLCMFGDLRCLSETVKC